MTKQKILYSNILSHTARLCVKIKWDKEKFLAFVEMCKYFPDNQIIVYAWKMNQLLYFRRYVYWLGQQINNQSVLKINFNPVF